MEIVGEFSKNFTVFENFFSSSTAGIKKFRCHFLKAKFEISLLVLMKVSFHREKQSQHYVYR